MTIWLFYLTKHSGFGFLCVELLKMIHLSICEKFLLIMLRSSITQEMKLKRKFFGALTHTPENLKPKGEATESDVRARYSNQI